MKCTIDHNADGALPRVLCVACNPVPAEVKAEWDAHARASERQECRPDYSAIVRAKKLRKLKAEERRISERIDGLALTDHKNRNRLYAAIKEIEDQIAAVA